MRLSNSPNLQSSVIPQTIQFRKKISCILYQKSSCRKNKTVRLFNLRVFPFHKWSVCVECVQISHHLDIVIYLKEVTLFIFSALNDSKYIGFCIYNVVIVCVFGVPLTHVLPTEQTTLNFVLLSALVMFCTTMCLCILFILKVRTVLCWIKIYILQNFMKTILRPSSIIFRI